MNAEEGAQGHKVLDRVVDGGAREDPSDGCGQVVTADENLRLDVSNLVTFVEDHSTPRFVVEDGWRPSRLALFDKDRVRSDDDVARDQDALWSVKHVNGQTRRKLVELVLPLVHDGLGNDDQRSMPRVAENRRDDLDGFSETHVVAQETTSDARRGFAIEHPPHAIVLVARYQTTPKRLDSRLETHGGGSFYTLTPSDPGGSRQGTSVDCDFKHFTVWRRQVRHDTVHVGMQLTYVNHGLIDLVQKVSVDAGSRDENGRIIHGERETLNHFFTVSHEIVFGARATFYFLGFLHAVREFLPHRRLHLCRRLG